MASKIKRPELIAPAGDWVSLRAAISNADAVYFGVEKLNMRANAKNFTINDISKVANLCHKNKLKAYLTLNTIIYDDEIEKIRKILKKAKEAEIDAIIAWDFSVVKECEKLGLDVHLSTQSSIANSGALLFLKNKLKHLKRVVLARELSLKKIEKIIKNIKNKIEIETFVHGAMCVSVSGRCFLSQELFGRSANRGDCLQPCRRDYIVKDSEEGHELSLGNNYVMSPKDLCSLPFIDKLIESGISAFKIEGRNRSPEYVKTVSSCYREAIDAYFDGKLTVELKKRLVERLKTVYNRGFSSGFYLGMPTSKDFTDVYGSKATTRKKYVGYVRNFYKKMGVAEIKLEAGDLKVGTILMFQGKTTGVVEQKVDSMELNHKKVGKGKKGQSVAVKVKGLVRENDRVYVIEH